MADVETTGEGQVLVIRVNRPDKYDALSPDMYHEPFGVQGLLKSERVSQETDHDSAVKQMLSDLVPVMKSEDAEEGVQSFIARRKAVFKGR